MGEISRRCRRLQRGRRMSGRSRISAGGVSVVFALLVLVWTERRAGADAPPLAASAPATTSSPILADQTTPRGAMRVLSEAMDAGDGAKMRTVLHATSPDEQKMVDALVTYRDAIAKFGKSAVTAFGAEDAKKLTGDTIQ